MNLWELVAFFVLLFIFGLGLGAFIVLIDVMFARLVRRARNTAEKMPFRSGLVGAVNLFFFSMVALILFAIAQDNGGDEAGFVGGVLRILALLIVVVLAGFIAFGIAAMARWLGERMAPEASPVRQSISGIATLELASLAPLVGWFVVPLVVVLVGYGAMIIALVWRRDG